MEVTGYVHGGIQDKLNCFYFLVHGAIAENSFGVR
ncbi:hypothetical protein ACP70R_029251 [Stipagrostis hirtigluma subsp. patula]